MTANRRLRCPSCHAWLYYADETLPPDRIVCCPNRAGRCGHFWRAWRPSVGWYEAWFPQLLRVRA